MKNLPPGHLLSFRGCSGRRAYLLAVLLALLCIVLPWMLMAVVGITLETGAAAMLRAFDRSAALAFEYMRLSAWLILFAMCASIVFFAWLLLAAVTRRLRDLGWSVWHVLWLPGLTALGWLLPGVAGAVAEDATTVMLLVLAIVPGRRPARDGHSPDIASRA